MNRRDVSSSRTPKGEGGGDSFIIWGATYAVAWASPGRYRLSGRASRRRQMALRCLRILPHWTAAAGTHFWFPRAERLDSMSVAIHRQRRDAIRPDERVVATPTDVPRKKAPYRSHSDRFLLLFLAFRLLQGPSVRRSTLYFDWFKHFNRFTV